jgi:phosphoglycerate kinase
VEEEGKGKSPSGDETKASPDKVAAFRKSLTALGDVYCNDAFGTAHRAHSSMAGVDLPDKVCGLLIQKELQAFSEVLKSPKRPLTAIVGGAKISDKIKLIDNLIEKADSIIICGGMAYTFLKVCYGMEIGKSLFDKKGADIVQGILDKAKEKGVDVIFPCDWICGQEFKDDQELKTVTQEEGIPEGWEGMDCGPKSIKAFEAKIKKSKTVVWNGPAGVFEFPNFSKGTNGILNAVAKLHSSGGRGIIGGGDSATAAANAGMEDKVSFVSTGGGASLELLEGKLLPGIVYLQDRPTELKVTNKKGLGFYIRAAKNFLSGFEKEGQEPKAAEKEITVTGLGNAISVAAAVGTTCEREGVAKMTSVQTFYPGMQNGDVSRGVAQIRIKLEKI